MDGTESDPVGELARRVGVLEDERAVRDHVTRYGFAVDVGDADSTAALYAEDCVIDIDVSVVFEGRDAARNIVHSPPHQAILPNCAHLMGPLVVTVRGDDAVATGYGCVFVCDPDDDTVTVWRVSYGRWELTRNGDGWLVTRRMSRAVGHAEAWDVLRGGL